MSKESYWAFTTIKMEKAGDWERQKILLKSPDYNKARRGRKSTSLTFYKLSFTLTKRGMIKKISMSLSLLLSSSKSNLLS